METIKVKPTTLYQIAVTLSGGEAINYFSTENIKIDGAFILIWDDVYVDPPHTDQRFVDPSASLIAYPANAVSFVASQCLQWEEK